MGLAYALFHGGHDVLDLARGQVVAEVHAEPGHDLARADVHGEEPAHALDSGLLAHDRADGVGDLGLRGLADEQALALAAEERRHQGEHDPDSDRSDTVEDGTLEELRGHRARQRDEQAEDGALSSNRTMNVVGSLLRRAASRKPWSPFSARNSLKATLQEAPSKTRASASTT